MKKALILVVPILTLMMGACGDPNTFGVSCVETEFDDPEWRDDLVYVETTNTPSVQIDRFVAANNLDTVHTSSGLVYSVTDPGATQKPVDTSIVTIWYRESFLDGGVIDQSNICSTGPLRTLVSSRQLAYQEGITKIGEGGKMLMLARPSLAYGTSSPSNGTNVLIYEIELLEIE